ncbi:MAG: glycosyltransferase family 4 protein [Nitrospirae bacterium]|nr:glycosyltransferase family 4 protein [Nitrospirota bacterium]
MNIAMFSEVSTDRVIGGAERVLREQALGMAKLGHQVHVITRMLHGDERTEVAVGDIRECRYPVSRTNEFAFVSSTLDRSVEVFDRSYPGQRIDVGLIHQSLAGLGPLLRRSGAVSHWFYMCLSLAHEEYMTRVTPGSSRAMQLRWKVNAMARRRIERLVMSRCERVLVLSRFMWDRVVEFHGIPEERLCMIPGAVDEQVFCPPLDRAAVRASLEFPEDRTVLFTVRNLVPRMGLEHFIEAVVRLGDRNKGLLVLIGGEGPLRSKLQNLIKRHQLGASVRLIGFVPERDLTRYYQGADLVVVPTLQLEGFGLVTVEAMACGAPVMATPIGALPEIINRLDPLLLAEGTNGAALARSLERILDRFAQDPDWRRRLAETGRRLVTDCYNWTHHTRGLERLLRESTRVEALVA